MNLVCRECHSEFLDSELPVGHAKCPNCGSRQVRALRVSPTDPDLGAVAAELVDRGELSSEAARTGLSLIEHARRIENTMRAELRASIARENAQHWN